MGRELVTNLHRAARQVDADPWGDCIWGIITGHTAQDALRIVSADKPLIIKRLLGTTNINAARFEHSCCITDWTNAPVLEQTGYTEPVATTYEAGPDDPLLNIFAEQLSTRKPQLLVSSSHATPFNLEMPFSRGLIFSYGNRFHKLPKAQFPEFTGKTLKEAMGGDTSALESLALRKEIVEPDGEPRVWLAAGNCLFGDVHYSPHSMCVTALSAYTCNQVAGYTVPSWYGEGGWGTLGTFCGNTAGTSLAEAWFLNNQFLLHRTMLISPELLAVHFDADSFIPDLIIQQLEHTEIPLTQENARDVFGLVYDRDVVAFYGDPAWRAQLDESHSQAPYTISWESAKRFTLTANYNTRERCAVWFPTAETGRGATGCNIPGAVFTNDFILFPVLELKKGESLTIEVK